MADPSTTWIGHNLICRFYRLLDDNLTHLVVPRLPDSHNGAIRLDLVNVGTRNPDLLRRVNRSRHNRRGNYRRSHHGSRDNARADDCVRQNATDDSADEPRPKMTPSVSPSAVMMVHRRRCGAMVHHGSWPSSEATVMAEAATRTAKTRASHKRSCRQNRAKCEYEFLVHVCLSFLRFCGHVKIGHKANKN